MGELHSCGCYDGPWRDDDKLLISVRCAEHRMVPALTGHVRVRREVAVAAWAEQNPRKAAGMLGRRMAIPKKRRRR